ncbi:MAG: EthD family reductase [Solirubrobacterales bacterium]|nr:EthD family reductase [Solirubrobacterales bacterium]
MTVTVSPATKQIARFVGMYDTASDIDAFERHYHDVHAPLAEQYPGLPHTRSHEPGAVIGEPC